MALGGTEGRAHVDQQMPHYRTSVWERARVRPEHFVPKNKPQQDKPLCKHLLKGAGCTQALSKSVSAWKHRETDSFVREISPAEPSQPAHNPPSRHGTGRLEQAVQLGLGGAVWGSPHIRACRTPPSCSEFTFPQLFSLDLGLLHTRRELGVRGE